MKTLKTLTLCIVTACAVALAPGKLLAQKTDSLTTKTDTLQTSAGNIPKVDDRDINAFLNRVKFYNKAKNALQQQLAARGTLNDNNVSLSGAINDIKNYTAAAQNPMLSPAERDAAQLKVMTVKSNYLMQEEIELHRRENIDIANDKVPSSASQAAKATSQTARLEQAAKTPILRVQTP